MNALRTIPSLVLTVLLASPGFGQGQDVPKVVAPQKYKLTVVQDASSAKRVKKNRVSAEMVVEVTDQNDVPVPGIAVSFTIPQLVGGGASFAKGNLNAVVSTNAAGRASSGTFVTGPNASFSMSVVASTPGTAVSLAVPVNSAAALAASGAAGAGAAGAAGAGSGAGIGISTGVLVGIIAGVAAVGAIVAKVALSGKGAGSTPTSPTTVGLGGATVGH